MRITNLDVIQSYILTSAKYDFSVYEKRILYRVIEILQSHLKGLKLNQDYSVHTNLFNELEIQMPVSIVLKDEKDKNHNRIKDALRGLNEKKLEYEDAGIFKIMRLINEPELDKYDSAIKFRLSTNISHALMNFSKGFRKYELAVAMSMDSTYSMRFYELFSGLDGQSISYSIDKLKAMFKLEDKYSRVNDFIKRVIEPAKKELDLKAPYSFAYKLNKKGKKYTSILFTVYKIDANRNPLLEERALKNKVSQKWNLKNETINYLQNIYFFSDKEISNNMKLIYAAEASFDLIEYLSKIKSSISKAENQQGYILTCLKNKLKATIEESKTKPLIIDLAKKFDAKKE